MGLEFKDQGTSKPWEKNTKTEPTITSKAEKSEPQTVIRLATAATSIAKSFTLKEKHNHIENQTRKPNDIYFFIYWIFHLITLKD